MLYFDQQKAAFVAKFIEAGYSYTVFKRRIQRETRNSRARIPDKNTVKNWLETFFETGNVHGDHGKNKTK